MADKDLEVTAQPFPQGPPPKPLTWKQKRGIRKRISKMGLVKHEKKERHEHMASQLDETVARLTAAHESLQVPTDLPLTKVAAMSAALNRTLADAIVLWYKTKTYHWHVIGPRFGELHTLFDEQAQAIYDIVDPIAERIRKVGGEVLATLKTLLLTKGIGEVNLVGLSAEDMVGELRECNSQFVTVLRAAHTAARDAGDVATTALIETWIDEAERRVWFLYSLLQKEGYGTQGAIPMNVPIDTKKIPETAGKMKPHQAMPDHVKKLLEKHNYRNQMYEGHTDRGAHPWISNHITHKNTDKVAGKAAKLEAALVKGGWKKSNHPEGGHKYTHADHGTMHLHEGRATYKAHKPPEKASVEEVATATRRFLHRSGEGHVEHTGAIGRVPFAVGGWTKKEATALAKKHGGKVTKSLVPGRHHVELASVEETATVDQHHAFTQGHRQAFKGRAKVNPYDKDGAERHLHKSYEKGFAAGQHHALEHASAGIVASLKLVKNGTHTSADGKRTAKVYKDHEWGEHRVKFFEGGKHLKNADYHTDDHDEAHQNAKHWVGASVEEVASAKTIEGVLSKHGFAWTHDEAHAKKGASLYKPKEAHSSISHVTVAKGVKGHDRAWVYHHKDGSYKGVSSALTPKELHHVMSQPERAHPETASGYDHMNAEINRAYSTGHAHGFQQKRKSNPYDKNHPTGNVYHNAYENGFNEGHHDGKEHASLPAEIAAVKGHEHYSWHTYKGERGVCLGYRGNNMHTILRKGMRFGLRDSANGKHTRLITEHNGAGIVHSISHEHAGRLKERATKVRGGHATVGKKGFFTKEGDTRK